MVFLGKTECRIKNHDWCSEGELDNGLRLGAALTEEELEGQRAAELVSTVGTDRL
jgi:hypothetical protein